MMTMVLVLRALCAVMALPNDLIAEMLEAFTHNILFVRHAYPHGIFQKRRLYSCVVYRSRFPPLNEYIANAIRSALFLLKSKHLNKFEVCFYLAGERVETKLESHFFDFCPTESPADTQKETAGTIGKSRLAKVNAEYLRLTQFEEKMRTVMLTLDNKCHNLNALPDRFLFKINLYTNQLGHCKLTEDEKLQEFPWIIEEDQEVEPSASHIVPLADLTGTQLFVQTYAPIS